MTSFPVSRLVELNELEVSLHSLRGDSHFLRSQWPYVVSILFRLPRIHLVIPHSGQQHIRSQRNKGGSSR
jgi:hypothetical protein